VSAEPSSAARHGHPGVLAGRVALITGTGGGMGRVAAQRFSQEGAIVVGCDLDSERHLETVELVTAAGGTMTGGAPIDLGDPDQARAWVDAAYARHGRIDIVFNNASAARFGGIDELSVEDWHYTVRNELDLVFYVTKFAWPHLRINGGVVINTASVAGMEGMRALGQTPHAATKGGVIALTRQLAVEGAAHNIRAVAISPGAIRTPPTEPMFADAAVRAAILDGQLVGRWGEPQDVIGLAVYLASDAASFITGANMVVDGGATSF